MCICMHLLDRAKMSQKRKLSKITSYFSSNVQEKKQSVSRKAENTYSNNEEHVSADSGCTGGTKTNSHPEITMKGTQINLEEEKRQQSAKDAESTHFKSDNKEYVSADSVVGDTTRNSCPEVIHIKDTLSHVQEKKSQRDEREVESISFESNKEEYLLVDSVDCDTPTPAINSCPETSHVKDISLHKRNGARIFDDEEKFDILTNSWVPNENFEFPSRQIGRQNRKFSPSWLKKYKWLAYSRKEDSAYCKVCILFAPGEVGMTSSQNTGQLVREGFFCGKKAIEKFDSHQKLSYHGRATLLADDFLKVMRKEKTSIDKSLDNSRITQAAENRLMLKPIINTVILCGRQNVALRGHRDYGDFDVNNPSLENEGNFRAFLRQKIMCGDENLQKHFQFCKRNAIYICCICMFQHMLEHTEPNY